MRSGKIIYIMTVCLTGLLVSWSAYADLACVSDKVGNKIDGEEREKYALFEKESNFSYAVFIQLKDGTYTLNIVYTDGSS